MAGRRMIARRLLIFFLLIAAAPAQAGLLPSQFNDFSFRQHPGAALPLDAVLRDEQGRLVRLGTLFEGRPAVVVLEYLRCPNLCGLVLAGLVRNLAAGKLEPGRDLSFIAISIDPKETPADGAAARASYVKLYGGKPSDTAGWHFLTGPAPSVKRIADAVGFRYRWDKSIGQFAHPAGFVVVTPDGHIARYMLGFAHGPAELKTALATAAEGQVQPPAHPLLLLCFGYDPQQGTIAYIVMQILRVLALAAVLACGFYIVTALRRERTR